MKKEKINLHSEHITKLDVFGGIVLLLIIVFIVLAFLINTKVDFSFGGECKAGYIGLDYEESYTTQNYTCSKYVSSGNGFNSINKTCYDQDTIKEHFNIEDLKDVKCSFYASGKLPILMAWFGDL